MIKVKQSLNIAIKSTGGLVAFSKSVGAPSTFAVKGWIQSGNVPANYCPAIERATQGAVRCEDLRPDVDWAYLRGTAVPAPVAAAQPQGQGV